MADFKQQFGLDCLGLKAASPVTSRSADPVLPQGLGDAGFAYGGKSENARQTRGFAAHSVCRALLTALWAAFLRRPSTAQDDRARVARTAELAQAPSRDGTRALETRFLAPLTEIHRYCGLSQARTRGHQRRTLRAYSS